MDQAQITDDHRTAVCVVYTADSPPGDLLDALIARRVDVRHETEPYAVLASLHEARPGRGEPRIPLVLAVIEPERRELMPELLDAVEASFPGCNLWQHRAADENPLSAVSPADRAEWRLAGASAASSTAYAPDPGANQGQAPRLESRESPRTIEPKLRLAAHEPMLDPIPHEATNPGDRSSDTHPKPGVGLSDDELRTLLGESPRNEQHIGP
ncbi:MAG: hypothetical protein AAF108_04965 [Planctomycetota bacterium]